MCLIMVLQHTVIIQVFGVFVPIQHKWSLNIACVQRHNFIQVSYSFNYNNPLNYLSSVKKKKHTNMGKNFVLDGGVAYCAYSTAVGRYYYVTVVNSYSTVDFTTTFWFTCYVYKMPLNLNVFNKESSCIISSYLFVSFFIHRLWRVPVDMCMKVTIRSMWTGPGSIN